MARIIPYGTQLIDDADIRAVVRVLKSGWISQGPAIAAFEQKLARFCGARFAVVVSSGTAALHLASRALDLGKGAEVITTPVTFLATSNGILYTGARPVFADIDPLTFNISPKEIAHKLSTRTKAIYPVHFTGLPCDMPAIGRFAAKHGLKVVEDACHALGAKYKDGGRWVKVGSCAHSDMTAFSFHPVKHITTGEGGALTTNHKNYYEKLLRLRNHGAFRSAALSKEKGPWVYQMRDLGFNYRMTDIQAALGSSQMDKLTRFISRRRQIASIYDKDLAQVDGLSLPAQPESFYHSYHLYVVRINFNKLGRSRAELMNDLKKKGVGSQVHYIPVYQHPYYRELGYRGNYPEAEHYYREALSLPLYPKMTDADVRKVVSVVRSVMKRTGK
jgi:UDP-4-amino-4,6-dideoxy-N-acetyl-beta-L-altrosamine transaminase